MNADLLRTSNSEKTFPGKVGRNFLVHFFWFLMESTTPSVELLGEPFKITINYKKQAIPIEVGLDNTLGQLRLQIAQLTGVAAGLQKLMYKGYFCAKKNLF